MSRSQKWVNFVCHLHFQEKKVIRNLYSFFQINDFYDFYTRFANLNMKPLEISFSTFYLIILLFCFCCLGQCKRRQPSSSTVPGRSSSNFSHMLNMKKAKCTEKEMHRMDLKFTRILAYGPHGRKYPSSLDGMKEYCA